GETVAILSASGSKVSEVKVAADGSWSLKAPTSTGTYYPTYNGTRGDNFTYTEADPVLAFELLTPQAGSTLSELKQAFTGTGTPGAEYTLRDGRNVIVASGTIPASGTWSVTADDLPVGALTLTAQMTLRGETHTEGLGSFTVAKDYPNSLNTPAKGDESITGTGTPGEIVSLHAANGSKVSESTVAPDGSWSLTAPAESGSYYPSYGGERGEDFGYEVADPVYEFGLLTPSAGSEISMENQEFTGTATPGSTVVLKDGNGNVLYEGKADEAGNWSGTVPKLPEGPLHLTIDNTLEGVTTTIDGGEFLAVAEGNGEDTPVLSPAIAGGYGLLLAAGTALGLRRNRSSKG
ncbi:Ig-like domain-containing protein, partial [Leucobacter luti]|uniref:Ig-like domain-containing protein n=1 Tax=Leucobacter luti TaxID=340320 RepID=UPI001AADDDCD